VPQILPIIAFPAIDPVAIEIGPLAIRWYALAYIAGLVLGWRYVAWRARAPGSPISRRDADDFLVWAALGIVLGGRLGSVLFYNSGYYVAHPVEILYLWRGGMSFHGGMLGMAGAIVWFSRRRGLAVLAVADLVACAAPIGLFFGRIANFINGELFGRPSEAPWAVIFPGDALQTPRHPSQIYEAGLEGLVLFAVLWLVLRRPGARARPGLLTGVFVAGYGLLRIVGEFFREPDANLGYLVSGATMGQLLSAPMVLFGLYLVLRARPATAR
jgi:phosphatidylglycerol:prolipoprotein diacylglycerol transferase